MTAETKPQTFIEQYIEAQPPCCICGKRDDNPRGAAPEYADLTQEDAAERWLECNERLTDQAPDLAALFQRMAEGELRIACESCLALDKHKRNEHIRGRKVERIRLDAFAYGAMPDAAKYATLALSESEVETLNREAWSWARTWRGDGSAWISGPTGTGKTHLARCVLNFAPEFLLSPREIRADHFNREAVRFDAEDRLSGCFTAGVLLLDDVDKAEWTRKGVEMLGAVLDRRWSDKRATLITSNVEPEKLHVIFADLVGAENRSIVQALFDRMSGWGRVKLEGKSLRRERDTV